MAETTTIARPYARAAFEEGYASGELPRWSDLLQTATVVAADPSMRVLLVTPQLAYRQKADLLLDICSQVCTDGIPAAGRNFLILLAQNHRLGALPHIVVLFEKLRAAAEKTIQAELVSAFPVTDAQRDQIAAGLQARLKRTIVLDCKVDESLIGGAIIRAGDLVIDGSVRGQLQKLATALHQ
jgi:F-type H+-transporting ATPase subunit delta